MAEANSNSGEGPKHVGGVPARLEDVKILFSKGANAENAAKVGFWQNLKDVWKKAWKGELHIGDGKAVKEFIERSKVIADPNIPDGEKVVAKKIVEHITKAKNQTFSTMTRPEKITATVAGNLGQSSGFERGVRIGGTAVGSIMVGRGISGIFSKQNEQDDKKPSKWKKAAELAGGALLIYASLIHGGPNKSMGLINR